MTVTVFWDVKPCSLAGVVTSNSNTKLSSQCSWRKHPLKRRYTYTVSHLRRPTYSLVKLNLTKPKVQNTPSTQFLSEGQWLIQLYKKKPVATGDM